MKQLITLLLLFLTLNIQSVWAQELTIKSFAQSATDITASTQSRLDGNGDACALVKVRLALPNAKFEGETVGSIENRDGEYWVYMVAGSKHLLVKQASVLPLELKFADYGISGLQAKNTYVLTLLSPQAGPQTTLTEQYVVFSVIPDVGKVTLDNKTQELNNGVTKFRVPLGQHKYVVTSDGYRSQEGVVTVGRNQEVVTLELAPKYGKIDIDSEPALATIWLDGKTVGKSPMIVEQVLAGTHQVELRKEGYQPFSQRVTIEEGKTASLSGSLVQTADAAQSSSSMSGQSSAANGAAKTFTVNGVSFTMIAVQGGTFQMGATPEQEDPYDSEKPVHSVTLSDYSIGETEVTQALWEAVMGKSVTHIAQEIGRETKGVGANYPMYYISWDDCQEFLHKLNKLTGQHFRLPTEAEWEYAARGGNKSRKTQYAGSGNIDEVAWYEGNSGLMTHAVKTKQPNELELYDMSGNVWEWCQDWFDRDYYKSGSQTNPTGPSSGSDRVSRGGGWFNFAGICRSADRACGTATDRGSGQGLRLAL